MQGKYPGWVKAILLYLAIANTAPGTWALFWPRNFYDSFPGFGRTWVSVDGPYNEHLVRDVGAFFLALAVLCFLTVALPRLITVRATAICLLVFNVPHLWYHLRHLHMLPFIDQVGNAVTLSVNVALLIILLLYRPVAERSQILF